MYNKNNDNQIIESGDLKKSYQWRIWKVVAELVKGFELVSNFNLDKTITLWGSAKINKKEKIYKDIQEFGRLAAKNGYTIVTGGGGGLMEAANKGCFEGGGKSVGLNIKLPREQFLNKYTTDSIEFKYFYIRKTMLSFISKHYVFAPGGFGTFDELFEMLTLIQTKKMGRDVDLILINKDFWQPFLKQIKDTMIKKYKTITKKDLDIIQLVDTPEEVMKIIMNNNKKLTS